MKRFFHLGLSAGALLLTSAVLGADEAAEAANHTAAAAALATGAADARTPDLLEHVVDVILRFFNVESRIQAVLAAGRLGYTAAPPSPGSASSF